MAPNIATADIEQRSMFTASSDDNISITVTRRKPSWLSHLWPKQWILNMKNSWLKKDQRSPRKERPKVAISKSPKRWFIPIMIHVIPILAGIAIAAINLKGYYVGAQFVGVANPQGQSTALFSLQVVAKALEIAVIASLGFIVLDVVHYFLLFDDAGLPFSLVGARLTFNDISYLASPAFWQGIGALRSRSTRLLVGFLLLSCGILATFIGPAAALLLIPSINPAWPAGGFRFLLPLTEAEFWPMQLNSSNTGPDFCVNPSEVLVMGPNPKFSYCLWYATAGLTADTMYNNIPTFGGLTVDDSYDTREISWATYAFVLTPPPTPSPSHTEWAWTGVSLGNNLASCLYVTWRWAIQGYREQDLKGQLYPLPLSYSRYPFRDESGDQFTLPGLLAPSARSTCVGSEQNFSSSAVLPYPAIPVNGTYAVDTNATFLIASPMAENTSIVRTFWTPKPPTAPEMQDVQADEEETLQFPSALLLIQIPTESESVGIVYTCSIDARWITNTTVRMQPENGQQLLTGSGPVTTYTQIDTATFDSEGRPSTTLVSPRVNIDISWLEQFTPTFNETSADSNVSHVSPGYTSLAKSLAASPITPYLQKYGQHYDAVYPIAQILENFIAMLTVDAMARINADSEIDWQVAYDWIYATNTTVDLDFLFPDGGGLDPLPRNASNMAYPEYVWNVFISGYAYSIESTGDILALAVVFVYMIFALGHIAFILCKRWYSLDWWSVADMIALSQNSPSSDLLKNTSGGIKAASTSRLLLKLRAPDVPLGDSESIQVLVCKDGSDPGYRRPAGYHKIEKEKAYC